MAQAASNRYGKGPTIGKKSDDGDVNRGGSEQSVSAKAERTASKPPKVNDEGAESGKPQAGSETGTEGVPGNEMEMHGRHMAEHNEMHARQMGEHMAMHARHSNEQHMRAMRKHHETHEEMTARHHKERQQAHTRHEGEMKAMHKRHAGAGDNEGEKTAEPEPEVGGEEA